MSENENKTADAVDPAVSGPEDDTAPAVSNRPKQKPGEIGGPAGPEPTRYGDWENKGRCSDF